MSKHQALSLPGPEHTQKEIKKTVDFDDQNDAEKELDELMSYFDLLTLYYRNLTLIAIVGAVIVFFSIMMYKKQKWK